MGRCGTFCVAAPAGRHADQLCDSAVGTQGPAITLLVYAHWLPDASMRRLVDRLDDTASDVTRASPRVLCDDNCGLRSVVAAAPPWRTAFACQESARGLPAEARSRFRRALTFERIVRYNFCPAGCRSRAPIQCP